MQTLSANVDHRSRRGMTPHALSSSDELIQTAGGDQEHKNSCGHDEDQEAHDWTGRVTVVLRGAEGAKGAGVLKVLVLRVLEVQKVRASKYEQRCTISTPAPLAPAPLAPLAPLAPSAPHDSLR